MDPRTLARLQALGRVVIGAALVVSPERAAAGWLGSASRNPATQVAIAALGVRDLALGLGTAWACGGGSDSARPWLLAGTLADAVDLGATIRYRDALSTSAVVGVGLIAGGSAALGLWLQSALD